MKIIEVVRYLFLVSVRYIKHSVHFFKQFVLFINELTINGSFRSLTESSVNLQKLSLVNGILPSPI